MHRKVHPTASERPYATILAVIIAALLFLNVFNQGTYGRYYFSSSLVDDDRKLELGNTQSLKTEIAGYWKEVRTSLGLGLLPDTVLFHGKVNGLDDSSHSTPTGRGNARKNVIDLFSNRLYRERLGRLHPAHLRRRDIPDSEETDVSYARENIDELSLAQAWDDNIDYYDMTNGQPGLVCLMNLSFGSRRKRKVKPQQMLYPDKISRSFKPNNSIRNLFPQLVLASHFIISSYFLIHSQRLLPTNHVYCAGR